MFQTIVSAMSMLTPPMPLGNPGNQFRVDYIKSIAPLSDFEYTEVTHTHTHTHRCLWGDVSQVFEAAEASV